LLGMMIGFSDTWLVGHFLDESHLAAMTSLNYVLWLLPNLFAMVSIGATAMVARFVGAGDRAAANRYLQAAYMPAHNAEFAVRAAQPGSAYVAFLGPALPDILCEHFERVVGNDNCVSFEGLKLQIPAGPHRPHYVKTRVRVHRYVDGTLALFHGPRRLDLYTADGQSTTHASASDDCRLVA